MRWQIGWLTGFLAATLGGCSMLPSSPQAPDAGPDEAPQEQVRVPDKTPDFAPALTERRLFQYTDDLDGIKKRGVLRVLTRNNSTDYFIYRGVEAGFAYELARIWAEEMNLRLEMVVPPTGRDLIPWLLQGKGDVIMADISRRSPRADMVRLTRPYMISPFVVVTRKAALPAINSLADLAGTTVTVSPSTAALGRMRELSRETPHAFHVQAALEIYETEDLLDLLSEGEIQALVAPRRIVGVELLHHQDLQVALELPGISHEAGIAVRRDNPQLHGASERFIRRHYRGTVFNMLFRKYHQNRRRAARVRTDTWRGDVGGALSPWDEAFKEAGMQHGIDWRLLVAQAYQESRFRPKAESPFGAVGLMQLLPRTAAELGVKNPLNAEQSIFGGTAYLRQLIDRYHAPDVALRDQIRFALAGYNVGAGHVDDARVLAAAQGYDPNQWFENVEKAMLLLASPRYHRRARFGYCRGDEPVRYVSEIQTRFDAYVEATGQAAAPHRDLASLPLSYP